MVEQITVTLSRGEATALIRAATECSLSWLDRDTKSKRSKLQLLQDAENARQASMKIASGIGGV